MTKQAFTVVALSVLGALLLPSLASAQEQPSAQAPAPQEGPQTYGQHLSQINGTPIKVGEHNEYYYDNKKINLSINPLGLMVDWYSIAASVAVSNHVAIRGDLATLSVDDDSSYTTMTIGSTVYFKKMYSGFFVEPGVGVESAPQSYDGSARTKRPIVQVITGWHWTFDSGLNVMAGFGMSRALESDNASGNPDVMPTGVFKVGYAL